MWKDFFYFTKTERQGIIVLVVLVIGTYAIPRLLQAFSQPEKTDPAEQVKAEKEYSDFISSVKKLKPDKKYPDYTNNRSSAVHPKKEIRLATFDPNMADSTTFLSLGLPSWMASNILRYRNRQGRFRRPEDFRKIYGLTEEQYRTLLPYIRIAEEPISPDTSRLLVVQATAQHDTLMKYHPGIIIDLNQADTTELKKIPGIGSRIAQSIVNRRRLLGGFYQIEQLVVVLCGCHTDSPDQHQQGKCRTNDAPSVHQLLSSQSDCGIPEEKREIKRFEATGTLRGIHFG